jgi:hypothetical protein
MVALLSLTKTPLLICRRRKSWRTLRTLGETPLILKRDGEGRKGGNDERVVFPFVEQRLEFRSHFARATQHTREYGS